MRLSAFTDILDRPFEPALDALAGIGLKTIDLRSKIGPCTVDTLAGAQAQRVAETIRRRGLTVGCVASWGVNSLDGKYQPADGLYRRQMVERTRHLAELATTVGAPSIRVYSFKRPPGDVTDADRADNAAFLAALAEEAQKRGRLLLIENEPPTLTATCAELADLIARRPGPGLKINWDIVNGWRAGELPWGPGVFEKIAGHVAHVHVKGARAAADGTFATMAVPGADDVPHDKLLRMLAESGFDGVITIDPHYGQFADADKLTGYDDPVLEVVKRTMACLNRTLK